MGLDDNFSEHTGNALTTRVLEGFGKADAQSRTGDLLITNQALYQLSYIGVRMFLNCSKFCFLCPLLLIKKSTVITTF